jgi:hypothetical protein
MPVVEGKRKSHATETLASLTYGMPFVDHPSSTSSRETTIVSYPSISPDITGVMVHRIDETRLNDLGRPSVLIDQLSGFQQLTIDWDGDGGVPTTGKAAATARGILELVEVFAAHLGMESSVDPLPNGGLDMEWVSPAENQLLVEIQPNGDDPNYSLCIKDKIDGKRNYWSNQVSNLDQILTLLLSLDR